MSSSLQDRIRTAFRFHILLRPLRVALYLVVPFVIGNYLAPEEYGAFAATFAVVTLVEGLCLPGVAPLLIRSTTLEMASSLFWLSLSVRLFFCLVFYVLAPYLSALLSVENATPYFRVLSLWFVLEGLKVIPDAILVRRLAYKTRFHIYALADLIGISVLVILLQRGWGTWALVGRVFFTSATVLILSAFAGQWRPQLEIRSGAMREFFSLNRDVTIVRLTNQYLSSIDSLLIVFLCGSGAAGLFAMTVKFVYLPLQQILWPAGELLLPIGKAHGDENGDVLTMYFRFTQLSLFVCMPLLIALTFMATHLSAVFGASWAELPPLIVPMSVVGFALCFAPPASLYVLTRSSDLDSKLSLFEAIVVTAGIVIGAKAGVHGAIVGMAISVVSVVALRLRLTFVRIGTSFSRYWEALKSVCLANLVLALVLLGQRSLSRALWHSFALDVVFLTLCLLLYLASLQYAAPAGTLKRLLVIRLTRQQKVPQ
ncbi:MAG: oligosaccharide flippase family protein [Bdellovibrionales bacterium]|nr:oligosaccharide flippase family protein [Bdellovibrionales bacterium]